jgi:hypothetical protein
LHEPVDRRTNVRCENKQRVPVWLKYMVLHFSGLVYKSAHGTAFRLESFLYYLRNDEVEHELGLGKKDKSLSDERLVELCLEARACVAPCSRPSTRGKRSSRRKTKRS